MIFVEGSRLASELIKSPVEAEEIFVSEGCSENTLEVVEQLTKNGKPVLYRVDAKIFASVADTDNSQGIVVLAQRPKQGDFTQTPCNQCILIYLNRVSNPSNLGAVVRTAEAAGASGVITSPGSADPFSPKAIRASMGSSFRVPIFSGIPLPTAIGFANEKRVMAVGADVGGSINYAEFNWRDGAMLVVGSEAHGLNRSDLSLLDSTVLIPMENGVESLNLAVSTGVILFEAKRQRSS